MRGKEVSTLRHSRSANEHFRSQQYRKCPQVRRAYEQWHTVTVDESETLMRYPHVSFYGSVHGGSVPGSSSWSLPSSPRTGASGVSSFSRETNGDDMRGRTLQASHVAFFPKASNIPSKRATRCTRGDHLLSQLNPRSFAPCGISCKSRALVRQCVELRVCPTLRHLPLLITQQDTACDTTKRIRYAAFCCQDNHSHPASPGSRVIR